MRNFRKGFTLIEILIVVAIIAILASVVLVGLGPTQSLGRDSRRVADLHEVQNGLELYYNKLGGYPGVGAATKWNPDFEGFLTGAGISVNSVPNDPQGTKSYIYGSDNGTAGGAGGTQYIVAAVLENGSGGPWSNYNPPTNLGSITHVTASLNSCTAANFTYCVTL